MAGYMWLSQAQSVCQVQARQQAQAVGGPYSCYGGGGRVGTFIQKIVPMSLSGWVGLGRCEGLGWRK
ncbi:Hypothetical protein FKW44_008575 [Caligus rogercresseyi]|uniref:Uncharacterized protein n=1 Tax=Caligus rogercresseyi TaxID=217165 RepID=A0A7T8KGD5_CALRO|nr:Hypothetical protein FKW44_008575 [Caligus rogercresseyi]